MKTAIFLFNLFIFLFANLQIQAQSSQQDIPKCISIYRDYELLCLTINRQHSPYPPSFNYYISAKTKNDDLLEIDERREKFYQNYTLPLRNIISFEKKTDSLRNEAFFIIEITGSILVENSTVKSHTKYTKQSQVSFTLENPYLIAETEDLLNTICRDNYRRKKLEEIKKLETTY